MEWIIIIFLLIVLSYIWFKKLENFLLWNKNNYSNFKQKNLFNKAEYWLMKQLQEYCNNENLLVLTKVRLADFIWINNFTQTDLNKISSKHIDFIILDNNLHIKVLIELDWPNHYKNKKVIRNDDFKNKLFTQLNIPLIRYKVGEKYNLDKIKQQIK